MNEQEDSTDREGDTGQGYPEQGPPGSGIDAREHPENDAVPDEEPETRDSDPSHATGNPKAAGGDPD